MAPHSKAVLPKHILARLAAASSPATVAQFTGDRSQACPMAANIGDAHAGAQVVQRSTRRHFAGGFALLALAAFVWYQSSQQPTTQPTGPLKQITVKQITGDNSPAVADVTGDVTIHIGPQPSAQPAAQGAK